MEPEFNWLSLPDHNLENILLFLDVESLLRATETCKKLQLICAKSSKLCRKIRLKVIIDENVTSELREIQAMIQMSERRYFNLHLASHSPHEWIEIDEFFINQGNLTKLEKIFGATVKNLKISTLTFRRATLAYLLAGFPGLQTLSLVDVRDASDEMFDIGEFDIEKFSKRDKAVLRNSNFPEVEELEMVRSVFFYFYLFENSLNLRKLVIDDMNKNIIDPNHFEPVLAKMKNLKDLKLQKFRSSHFLSTDHLANPSFQLDSLSMTAVYWDAKESGTAFFKSQRSLKRFHLALKNRWGSNWEEEFWFNDILKHVFVFNRDLHTVSISTAEKWGYNIQFTDFLDEVVCPKVETLTYAKGPEDDSSALMEAFVKMFPNLKQFVYKVDNDLPHQDLSLISRWTKLETLNVSEVRKDDLQEIQVTSPNFYKIEIRYYATFSCHPTVRHLLFSYDSGFDDRYFEILAESFPNLEILTFRWSSFDPKQIDMLCLKFKKLRLIQVDETIEANDEFRAAATKHGIEIKFDCV